jgi:hypothetical protein
MIKKTQQIGIQQPISKCAKCLHTPKHADDDSDPLLTNYVHFELELEKLM